MKIFAKGAPIPTTYPLGSKSIYQTCLLFATFCYRNRLLLTQKDVHQTGNHYHLLSDSIDRNGNFSLYIWKTTEVSTIMWKKGWMAWLLAVTSKFNPTLTLVHSILLVKGIVLLLLATDYNPVSKKVGMLFKADQKPICLTACYPENKHPLLPCSIFSKKYTISLELHALDMFSVSQARKGEVWWPLMLW